MSEVTSISAELIRAYLATDYQVLEPPAFSLKIGRHSRELEALCRRFRATTAAVVTAWNPYSERKSDEENDAAQAKLIADLDEAGLTHLPALGADPSGRWPGEPSRLVLGLSIETGKVLGLRYGQNCIVWVGIDAIPQISLLR